MAEVNRCPQCGCDMPPDSPAGLCPDCLLGAGLAVPDSFTADQMLTEAVPKAGFVPPKPRDIADRFPQFEILDLLGYGGMGAVYKARQKSLDRLVALKIIKPDAADNSGFSERFEREAKALAKLNHSNIVSVHDSGASDGLYYFVMEYVDGTNLRRLIESKELPPEQAVRIIPQICEALQYAHDEGIVHRDIKPENILVDSRGRVKIADFGLAKLLGNSAINAHTLTGTHQVMGTPRYMAPEQMEGSKAVDHRADIYSLGVVFYEMLTGELPMGSFEPPSRKAQVDARLDDVVLRSLAKEPERRYQHASDVRTDVEAIQSPIVTAQFRDDLYSPVADSSHPTRCSRKAIIGACWVPLFFVGLAAVIVPTVTLTVSLGEEPPAWPFWRYAIVAAIAAIGLAGMAAPFGTTILGFVAMNEIRHSRGQLSGLGLAFFDAVFFPLLIVDVLLVACAFLAAKALLTGPVSVYPRLAPVLLAILLTNAVFVVWAWRRVAIRPGQLDKSKSEDSDNPPLNWSHLIQGLCIAGPILGLIGFALWYTETAWVLAALVIPWFGVCADRAYHEELKEEKPRQKAAKGLLLITFCVTIGLIAIAIAIENSAWPLFGIAPLLVGGFLGFGLGHIVGEGETKGESAAGEDSDDNDEEEDSEEEDEEESPEEKLEWAAWWVGLIGVARSWALLSGSGNAIEKLVAGDATILNHELLLELTGPVMFIAAIAAYHARFYWFAVVGAVLCLPTGNCLPVILGFYSLVTLFDPKVRALFLANEATLAGVGEAKGDAQNTRKPPMPRGYGDAIGSTLSNAWTEWWRERDALFTRVVQTVILLLHLVCLLAFLGFSGKGGTNDEGQHFFTHNIGFPAPWFTIETSAAFPDFSFSHEFHWSTSAWLVAGLGLGLAYVYCRIEKCRNPDISFWHKPESFMLVWAILAVADIGLGAGMGHLAMNAHPPNKTAERDAKEKTPSEDTELMQQITIDTQVAALIEAVTQGNFSRVKAQLDAGASVNAKNEEGRTLLMQSIASGHRSLALTLIVLGADLTEQDERGRTALMYAVEADDKVFISRLRELSQIAFKQDAEERKSELRAFSGVERSLLDGRDFDLRNIGMSDLERQADENGETASLIAAREGDWKLLSQVASTVDSLKAQDNRGRTLPMHAAIHGRLDWFERLASPTYLGIAGKSNVFVGEMLAFDVDQLALADSDGKTAVQLADEHGHTEIADILRRHLQAIVDNQTAEIEKGGDDVSQHRELRRQAWQALGDPEKSQQDSDKSMEEID